MKRFWKNIVIALALPLFTVGCTTDYPEPDANGLPQASDFKVTITVDDETNYVTFTLDNKGMVPIWIFGDEMIDGSANKKYAYTQNGLQLRFRDAGEHSVEVKAYNVNGLSVGSQVVPFVIANDYRDPFDEAPYRTAISGGSSQTWMWDTNSDKHFGCGQTLAVYGAVDDGYGRNWWAAAPNAKPQLQDDRLVFTSDGAYSFDPGEDGMVYVNTDSGYKTEYNTGEDYLAPMDPYTTTYSFEQVWNSAGIEEIYLVLPANSNLSYIPNPTAYAEPRFMLLSSRSQLRSMLSVVIDTPIAGEEGISWYYQFVPEGSGDVSETFNGQAFMGGYVETALEQGSEIPVTGIDLTEIWIDPDFFTLVDAATLRFNAVDGDYRVVWDGRWFKTLPLKNGEPATYDNNGTLYIIGDGGGKPYSDVIGWVTESALPCARIDDNTHRITLYMTGEGGSIKVYGTQGWAPEWTKSQYGSIEGNGLFDIPDDDGNIHTDGASAGFYTFTFVDNGGILDMSVESSAPVGPTLWDATSDSNLWLSADPEISFWFADGSWSQIADPDFENNGDSYVVTMPAGMGGDQWMGQVTFLTTINSESGKYYDFQVVLNATADNASGVTIKLCNGKPATNPDDNDKPYYFADRHSLHADEDYVYRVSNFKGEDCTPLKLIFDFGGCPAGSKCEIKEIIFQEHQVATTK